MDARRGGIRGSKGDGRSPSFLCGIPARGKGTVEKKERERQSDIIDFDSSPIYNRTPPKSFGFVEIYRVATLSQVHTHVLYVHRTGAND